MKSSIVEQQLICHLSSFWDFKATWLYIWKVTDLFFIVFSSFIFISPSPKECFSLIICRGGGEV